MGGFVNYLHSVLSGIHNDKHRCKALLPPDDNTSSTHPQQIDLVLGGYSYGSLILTQLPRTGVILQRFQVAEQGTSAHEIRLRARTLASETLQKLRDAHPARGRTLRVLSGEKVPQESTSRSRAVVYGGEETPQSIRRHSREGRHSVEVIRRSLDVPRRLKDSMRGHSSNRSLPSVGFPAKIDQPAVLPDQIGQPNNDITTSEAIPHVRTSCLLISPLLPPVSLLLCVSVSAVFSGSGKSSLESSNIVRNRTLVIYGTKDMFTASKKLAQWSRKIKTISEGLAMPMGAQAFESLEVYGAGHFWREPGVGQRLCSRISEWLES